VRLSQCRETYSSQVNVCLRPEDRAADAGNEVDGNVLPMSAQSCARAVVCNDRPLTEQTSEALRYLIVANGPPAIFSRDRELVRVDCTTR
jgi:hypothetical protein